MNLLWTGLKSTTRYAICWHVSMEVKSVLQKWCNHLERALDGVFHNARQKCIRMCILLESDTKLHNLILESCIHSNHLNFKNVENTKIHKRYKKSNKLHLWSITSTIYSAFCYEWGFVLNVVTIVVILFISNCYCYGNWWLKLYYVTDIKLLLNIHFPKFSFDQFKSASKYVFSFQDTFFELYNTNGHMHSLVSVSPTYKIRSYVGLGLGVTQVLVDKSTIE